MQHKSFENVPCPIARSLARVGEWWSMLILRDALHGMTRFDQFQKSLGIAPNMLTRRLNALVDAGLLSRRRYSEKPPRDEYLLTARGRDFRPVLLVDAETGAAVDPILVDPATGRPINTPDYALIAGPAAGERTRRRYAAPKPLAGEQKRTPANRKRRAPARTAT